MPKVSVIIPVYNVEKYLRQCLDSVINQTLKDIEIICVDDGSTDSSLSILREYAQKDSRINIIDQKNQGPAIARNIGLNNASGDYILILDSDDIYDVTMCEKMYKIATENNLDIAICHSKEFDNKTGKLLPYDWYINDSVIPKKRIFNRKDIPDYIIGFCQGWSWDKLYRREFIESNNLRFQNLRNTDDMFFVMYSLCIAERISVLNDTLVYHRTNLEGSVSSSRDKDSQCFIDAIYLLKKSLEKRNLYTELKRSFINWNVEFCFWHLDTLQLTKNKKNLIKRLKKEVFHNLDVYSFNKEYFYNSGTYKRVHDKSLYLRTSFIEKILSIKNSKDKTHKIITILGIKFKFKRNKLMLNNKYSKSVKIMVVSHKPFSIPKGNCFVPVHAGRSVALCESKDGILKSSDLKWMIKNTIGDDQGESISDKNRLYSEVSAIYWAWKNYDELGNPDYIGLMHYRRYFIFNEEYFDSYNKDSYQTGLCFIPVNYLDKKCIRNIGLCDSKIIKACQDVDIIVTKDAQLDIAYNYDKTRTIRGDYATSIPGVDVKDFDLMIGIIKEKYPEYSEILDTKINGYKKSLYNMFIIKKEIFFEMCEFLFDILFEIEKRVDFSEYSVNGKRTLGYLSEIIISIFIWLVEDSEKYKIKKFGTIFVLNANNQKTCNLFFQKLFSIRNSNDKKHKVITILGIKIKIKRGV